MSIEILNDNLSYESFNFPVGEKHVRLVEIDNNFDNLFRGKLVHINWNFECNEEIIELLLLCDAINSNSNFKLDSLILPYVPFGRQDRRTQIGECFSLKVFCNLINSLNFTKVIIYDAHSDVTTALLNNVEVIKQSEIFLPYLLPRMPHYLVSCDAGANKKIYDLAKQYSHHLGVIECSKIRNTTDGKILGVKVHADNLEGHTCIIVDDICDGGRSFIEVAKVLKEKGASKVVLMVTHGFFTHPQGVHVFHGLIDEVYTRNGKVNLEKGA